MIWSVNANSVELGSLLHDNFQSADVINYDAFR